MVEKLVTLSLKTLYSIWAPYEQAIAVLRRYSIAKLFACPRSQQLRRHANFANIFAKSKKLVYTFLLVHRGQDKKIKKGSKSRDTVPLNFKL